MKQRLIGTVVLGCLALIFIPIMLDGEGIEEPTPLSVNVPPAPEIVLRPLPDPVRPVILSDTDALDINPNTTTAANPVDAAVLDLPVTELPTDLPPDEAAPIAVQETIAPPQAQPAAVTEPRLTTQGLPQGWSVKLGTFGDRANAESLVAKLLLENYKAYSRPVQSGGQSMLAVYVGPVLTQAEAGTLQAQLKSNEELKVNDPIIVQFTIDTPVQGQ